MMNERECNCGCFTVALYERNFGSEVSGDFTLPDYYAEIRRILCVTPTVLPPAKYVGDSTAEFNGVVDYVVTYVGGDGEMYSIPLSSDYSFTVPLDKSACETIPESISALCTVGVESVNTRVSAPRRLSIRCRIRPNVRIYARIGASVSCDSEVAVSSIQTRRKKSEQLVCESATSDIIPVTVILPAPAEDIRILRAEAVVDTRACDKTSSGLSCRGDVNIRLLTVREESGENSVILGSVPYEGEIDLEGEGQDVQSRVRGIVSELSVNVTDSGIECSAGVILEAVSCHNEEVEYTDDVYSTENECECSVNQVNVKYLSASFSGNFTVSERLPIADTSLPQDAQIIEAFGSATMDKCEAVDGKYSFGGNAVFTVIYRKDGELFCSDVSVPIKYQADGACDGGVVYDCVCSLNNVKLRLDGENLCVDAEVGIMGECVAQKTVSAVQKVDFGAQLVSADSQIIICYPTPDDDLWSVAKRYRVAASSVIGDPVKDRFVIIE